MDKTSTNDDIENDENVSSTLFSQIYQTNNTVDSSQNVDVVWDYNSPRRRNNNKRMTDDTKIYVNNKNNNNNYGSPKPLTNRPIKRNLSNNQLESFKKFQDELVALRNQISHDETMLNCNDYDEDLLFSSIDIDDVLLTNNSTQEVDLKTRNNNLSFEDDGYDDLFASIDIPVGGKNVEDKEEVHEEQVKSSKHSDEETARSLSNELKAKIERNRLEAIRRLGMKRQRNPN